MHTLIVYEQRPEEISFYLIPNEVIDQRQRELLALAHNVLVNSDDANEGTDFLAAALAEKKEDCFEGTPEADKCIFHKFKYDIGSGPIGVRIDIRMNDLITHMYYSGFIL